METFLRLVTNNHPQQQQRRQAVVILLQEEELRPQPTQRNKLKDISTKSTLKIVVFSLETTKCVPNFENRSFTLFICKFLKEVQM
jgi:hypothetical protein